MRLTFPPFRRFGQFAPASLFPVLIAAGEIRAQLPGKPLRPAC